MSYKIWVWYFDDVDGNDLYLMNRSSPKVVEENVGDRRLRSQVSVLLYGTDVVEDETTV